MTSVEGWDGAAPRVAVLARHSYVDAVLGGRNGSETSCGRVFVSSSVIIYLLIISD